MSDADNKHMQIIGRGARPDADDMIVCELDSRHHGKQRRPLYPRRILDELQKQIEFAYPYNYIEGNAFHNHEDQRRQNAKRDTYVIAFLNGIDIMRPYFNAFNTLDTMLNDCMTGDGKKITKAWKVIDNLKNRAK